MKIDIFNFNNEYELLELRMRENWDFFDKFILIEGDHFYSGEKRNSIKNNIFFKNNFEWAQKKLTIYTANLKSEVISGFDNDILQRKFAEKIINNFNDEDILFYSAVDEIPNVDVCKNLIFHKELPIVLEQKFFYYFLNGRIINHQWNGTIIFNKKILNKRNLVDLEKDRYLAKNFIIYKDGGWHFSYLGSYKRIFEKVKHFTHQEYNTKDYLDENNLINKIKNGKDIFGRVKGDPALLGNDEMIIKYVRIDKSFPEYLKKNKKKYKSLINKIDFKFLIDNQIKKILKFIKHDN